MYLKVEPKYVSAVSGERLKGRGSDVFKMLRDIDTALTSKY